MKKTIDIPVPINLGKKTEEQPIKTEEESLDLMDPTTDFKMTNMDTWGVDLPPDDLANVETYEPSKTKKKSDLFFASKREKWIFLAFITPPFVISFISMLHMVSLFETSNLYWMAVTTAIAVELAAMSSLVALVTLNKLNKTTIWSIFGVLAGLQILGNMYHAFINMSISEINSILTLLALENTPWAIRLVMFLVSGILPVIALTFVKGIVDYFKER